MTVDDAMIDRVLELDGKSVPPVFVSGEGPNVSVNIEAMTYMRSVAPALAREVRRLRELVDDLRVMAQYWNEARHIIPQPSVPRLYSEDICTLRDVVLQRDRMMLENHLLRAENERLREALIALEYAAGAYAADQAGAHPQCGHVQPVTVAECLLLNQAMAAASAALRPEENRNDRD